MRNILGRTRKPTSLQFPALALCACAILALWACTTAPEGGAPEPEGEVDLFAHLPGPASVIAWVDFDALRGSTLAMSYLEDEELIGEADEELQEFIDKTGIDPRTDLKQIAMVAFDGEDGETEGVMVGSVNFDRERLMTSLADSPTITYRDHILYELEQDEPETAGEGEEEHGAGEAEEEHGGGEGGEEHGEVWVEGTEDAKSGYLVILNSRTLMVGSEIGVTFALDAAAGERPTARDEVTMDEMIMNLPGDDQIWVIAADEAWAERLEEMPEEGASPVPIPLAAIEGVEVVTFGMYMSDSMRLRLSGIAASEEDASMISQSMLGLLAMGKMMIQQAQPELFNIIDRGLLIDSDDRAINIEANLSAEDIATLRELAEERVGEAIQGIEG